MAMDWQETERDRLRRAARHFRDTARLALTERSRDYFNRLAEDFEVRAKQAARAAAEVGDD